MTLRQIIENAKGGKYMILRRESDNTQIGINCGIFDLHSMFCHISKHMLDKGKTLDDETNFVSCRLVGLNEYITYKAPFL